MAIQLIGKLICASEEQAAIVREYLPEHIRLTRGEPGCLQFEVVHAGAMTWTVDELFADRAAFEAHQARTRASVWGERTLGIAREYEIRDTLAGAA
ncbi:putative quinol monooxygenase [Pararhodobacter sp.]|uniref:putative quinol monooxygenase n=1 Tax=Pararhodobacter sp. TaxID=2127056 RepID=UPI002FE2EC9C|nr:antibiotic biosynthesis monooxygenase [Pseudomonadota bacterium]